MVGKRSLKSAEIRSYIKARNELKLNQKLSIMKYAKFMEIMKFPIG